MAQKWIAPDFGGPDVLRLVEVEVPAPKQGEVTIAVRAAGMNPVDYKRFASGTDRSILPLSVGFEVAGVISALGPDTEIASGGGAIGDEVLAFRIQGGYASAITVPARDVFAKPKNVDFAQAANLLLAGATAAHMLAVAGVTKGDTIVLHGASGAVGVSVLQQAHINGVRVVGTASEKNFETIARFGGIPVAYGPGLLDRIRQAAPDGVVAALDAVGTDEAIDTSLALVEDRARIVSIAAFGRAQKDGYQILGGMKPEGIQFRDKIRSHLIELAGQGKLVVPIAQTFPFTQAKNALELLASQHPGGKLALIVE
ncbi:NADP-dependent oxidoreductase [Tengunoibacter tsumagoiensis]|uniref:Oxidoreductase n=1 Tax=Tengunoibacter tsumagoiensis TaxID=2014871 RepID=A0A402A048_9CHLR|nr:NADP-dependent oxidoreductase [Tengunoibacter tsumagoiensis]GCE12436.1 oxidoreductase [Tengunoibacter tsumagoiensis]